FEKVVVFEDTDKLQQVGLLIVPIGLHLADEFSEHGAKGEDRIDAFGAKDVNALIPRLGVRGQSRHDQNFAKGVTLLKLRNHFLESLLFEKPKQFRSVCQQSGTEDLRVPRFDDDERALDKRQICRTEHKRQVGRASLRMGINRQKINVVVFTA